MEEKPENSFVSDVNSKAQGSIVQSWESSKSIIELPPIVNPILNKSEAL